MAGTKEADVGTMKVLLKNTGNYALVDNDDYDLISGFSPWYENDSGYAVKKIKIHGKNVSLRMHRVIADPPKGLVVDHINGNRLDNRRSNLRCVSQAINAWNSVRHKPHTVYDLPEGISYDKERGKYIATKIIRKRFDTLHEAIEYTEESEKLDYVR